ncbi:MAG: hypothetical protein QW750_08490 [Zestosphaera sp.]
MSEEINVETIQNDISFWGGGADGFQFKVSFSTGNRISREKAIDALKWALKKLEEGDLEEGEEGYGCEAKDLRFELFLSDNVEGEPETVDVDNWFKPPFISVHIHVRYVPGEDAEQIFKRASKLVKKFIELLSTPW